MSYDFPELFARALNKDYRALWILDSRISDMNVITREEKNAILERGRLEAKKSDKDCNQEALYLYARIIFRSGWVPEMDKAIKIYRRLIKLGFADAYVRLGDIYHRERGDVTKAKKYYKRAVQLNSPPGMIKLATIYARHHHLNYRKAVVLLRQALRLLNETSERHLDLVRHIGASTADPFVHYHLAMLHKDHSLLHYSLHHLLFSDKKTKKDNIVYLLNDELLNEEEYRRYVDYLLQNQLVPATDNLNTLLAIIKQIPDYKKRPFLLLLADALFNALECNEVDNDQLPAVLYTIETTHRTLLEGDCKNLTLSLSRLPDQNSPHARELKNLIHFIQLALQQNGPIHNLMPDTGFGDNWDQNWSEAKKHLLLYVERKAKIEEKYAGKLRDLLFRMDQEIKTTQWQKPSVTSLWRNSLPPFIQDLARVLRPYHFRDHSLSLQDLLYAGARMHSVLKINIDWIFTVTNKLIIDFYNRSWQEFQQMEWQPEGLKVPLLQSYRNGKQYG